MSGREIAEQMLADHGITGVNVVSVQGQLTDHYNPGTRTVNLSEAVYNGRTRQRQQWPRTNVAMPCSTRPPTSG
jgi:Zn-dependent membrane protease YugP